MITRNTPPQSDIILQAGEDLYSNASLMFTKCAHKRLPITRPRQASSYCHQFCGLVGVPFHSVRFTLDSRPLDMDSFITAPSIIKVFHSCEILQSQQNSLQPALLELLNTGISSDVTIQVCESFFPAHRCILMCRSQKFKAMFLSEMKEKQSNMVELDCKDPVLFDKMLKWIYTGSTLMPEEVQDVCQLLLMADEYFLNDLKSRCQQDLVSKITPDNVVELMVAAGSLPLIGNSLLKECKEVFVKEFHYIRQHQPNLEEMIASVPGLMTELFQHFHRASAKTRKRRVTFRINEGIVDTMDDVSTVNSGYSSAASSYTQQ